jgi:hypothetical protein
MRAFTFALTINFCSVATAACAHGPQIQITRDNDQITTRRLLREEPYSSHLTRPTSVYVIPLMETQGTWYTRPNNTPSDTLPGLPEYLSGPGIAYGYDQADSGPRVFASGQHFELKIIDGLGWWNAGAFVDPGLEQIEASRSAVLASTNDSLTNDAPATLPFSNVSATYNASAHSGVTFRLLGDGASATSASDDGVYLITMHFASTEPGLAASDPLYFVLHKNAASADILSAVSALGVDASSVQYVPEPAAGAIVGAIGLVLAASRRAGRQKRRSSP